ncbi:MAG: regulatory protein RecX [Candidatus Thiodiazotropha sp.]
MSRKLLQRKADPTQLEQVLDQLQQDGLQSDERFTESLIESRIRKGQGPLRIRRDLEERGIDGPLAERYLDDYREEWSSLLRQVHDAKFGSGQTRERRELAKRARFLEYRGFPAEMIRSLLFD